MIQMIHEIPQDQTRPLRGHNGSISLLTYHKVRFERKSHFIEFQAVKTTVRHPDSFALRSLLIWLLLGEKDNIDTPGQ